MIHLLDFIKKFLFGLLIGIAAVTPGLSGGVIAAAMGLYEPGVRTVAGFFKHPRESVIFLLPLGAGAGAGILVFSNLMQWLIERAPYQVMFLFFGLVAGSLPSVVRQANRKGFHLRYIWAMAIALGLVLCADWLGGMVQTGSAASWDFGHAVLYGIVLAVGTIVPGISSSFMLMYLGAYEGLLKSISTFDIPALLPLGIGFLIGAAALIKLVEVLFRRYPGAS
jgi:putative membrane protein